MNYLPYNVKLIESKIDYDNILHLTYCYKPIKPIKYIKCNVIIKIKREPQEGEWFEYENKNDKFRNR